MWSDTQTMKPHHLPHSKKWPQLRKLSLALLLAWACTQAALADTPTGIDDLALPTLCSLDNSDPGANPKRPAEMPEDCFEFGASMGELGLKWRQKLPQHVRWLTRNDAPKLCTLTQTDLGQLMSSLVPGGCVFLAPNVCTIVTAGHISPASLSNAVRHCVP